MTRSLSCLAGLTALALAVSGLPARAASAEAIRSEYVVSIYGLVIARSQFISTITPDRFDIKGSLSSAGIARIFDDTRGTTVVSGRFNKGRVYPAAYDVSYVSGDKKKRTTINFSGGRVARAVNRPPVNTKRDGWVPVSRSQLAAVADPLSATLVPAARPADVCRRTVRFFDGALRADIHLAPAGPGSIDVPGYSGGTVTCSARFVPVAGYRKGHSSIEYLRNSRRILIAFAPVGSTGIYAPVEASVATKIGTVHVKARRFEPVR
ncbi:DUF3108 domain-containing protein [Mesorhizobium xinjiangense]|uniref:DUF3108 domain-containing protein n=1 Tax=Mesorhizobium xinjiangense TaxID=2678685 RepID=UPI0012EECBE6|nr:DUF3108 domain-containing protein [Mesorhizobium xinjiangense]